MIEENIVEDALVFANIEGKTSRFADAVSQNHIKAYSDLFPLLTIKDLGVIPEIPYIRCFGGSGLATALQIARNTVPRMIHKDKEASGCEVKYPPSKTLVPAKPLQEWVKSPLYWTWRIEDAVENGGVYPSYYELGSMISWGMAVHFPKLSEDAKKSLVATHTALAVEIEILVASDPGAFREFEKSPKFGEIMLQKHTEIYRESGLQNLSPRDLVAVSKVVFGTLPPEVLIEMGPSCLHEIWTLILLHLKIE